MSALRCEARGAVPGRTGGRAAALVVAAAVWLVACTCADKPAPKTGSLGARAPAGPSQLWLDGRLPPEVLAGTPEKGGTFTMRVPVEPGGLNRLHDQMAEGNMVRYTSGTLYESLAELDRTTHPRYDLKPLLAQSWEESEDHLTLTVHLRRGVKFHNGDGFTSRDVKAVVEAVRDPKNQTRSFDSFFDDLHTVETPDPHTVVFKWKRAYFLANRNLLTALPMMPARALEGDFDTLAINRAPIGTGPFRFKSWDTGKSLTFEKNPDYWGPEPFVDQIVVRFVKDDTIATQMWERGEFELMTGIPPTVWKALEAPVAQNAWATDGYHRVRFVENNYGWLGWNEERPFFKDVRVRRALGMLYPADKVARNIDMGLELPTTCPYYRESSSCDGEVKPLPYDPKQAGRLLDEAGWVDSNGDGVRDQAGVPFKFVFLSNPYSVKLGKLLPLLQEEYRKAGIEMEIEKVEAASYLKRLRNHEFDAGSLTWSSADTVQDQYQIFHSSQAMKGGSNMVSYASPPVDTLLERIRIEFDPDKRAALERQLHRAVYDDQVYTFLTNRPALHAFKSNVRGIAPSIAWYDLRRVWLKH